MSVLNCLSLRLSTVSCAVVTTLASFAAHSEVCTDTVTSPSYLSCVGSFAGNIDGSAAELSALAGAFGGTWAYAGKSDDLGFGPFTGNPGTNAGTLTFDAAVYGSFVVGLKAATQYSYYLFDGGVTGITSINFTTLGVAQNGAGIAQNLSHAALYLAPVPEPQTYALLLLGLAALGAQVRRRQP
jgi:PEP-CTERM motif